MQWIECTISCGNDTDAICQQLADLGVGGMSVENEQDFKDFLEENRAYCNFTQRSFYYAVETEEPYETPKPTDKERKNKTEVLWLPFEELYHRIASPCHTTNQRKYVQARDLAALDAYRNRKSQG